MNSETSNKSESIDIAEGFNNSIIIFLLIFIKTSLKTSIKELPKDYF